MHIFSENEERAEIMLQNLKTQMKIVVYLIIHYQIIKITMNMPLFLCFNNPLQRMANKFAQKCTLNQSIHKPFK